MKNYLKYIGLIIILTCALLWACSGKNSGIRNAVNSDRFAVIDPDYSDITIPPNIAPLNFRIQQPGSAFYAKIYSSTGDTIKIAGKGNKILIPAKPWRTLLTANAGKELFVDIYIQGEDGVWSRFKTITNHIATQKIDNHLAYRLINPAFNYWRKMGLYQRDLESFKQSPILVNRMTEHNCMNCHNFGGNSADKMLFHMRAGKGSGMMLYRDGKLVKVNTATDFNVAGAYPSWHPNGNLIALSVNKLQMFYHSVAEPRDVIDFKSDLIIYDIDANRVTANTKIADPDYMETFPNWSGDGKYLYFCRASRLEKYILPENDGEDLAYDRILYDLARISYDPATGNWGELEVVINAQEINMSVIIPKVSPDNRFLMFTLSLYGSFPIYHSHSDLYLLNLENQECHKLECNSASTDSYHSWSSDSRWFVFSSKRRDEVCSRPYFSYLEENGHATKPFLLPQKDPDFYDTFFKTYNVPELFNGPVQVSPQQIVSIAHNQKKMLKAELDPALKGKKQDNTESTLYQQAKR